MTAFPRSVDLETIPLEVDSDRTRSAFDLGPPLLRHDGTMYGGTAIAASIMAMEAASERDVQWVTTQFVAPVPNGSRVEVATDLLANGRRTAQVRCTGTVGPDVMFTSIGSTGARRTDGLTGVYEEMPVVAPPDQGALLHPGPPGAESPGDPTFRRIVEYRETPIERTPRAGAALALWSRFTDGRPMTPAGIAFVADMVPIAVARAAGKLGAGMSLDNSLRFGMVRPVEWVLLELQGNLAAGGYGHGTVRAWSDDGELLAIGGQTATMIYLFDEGELPAWQRR